MADALDLDASRLAPVLSALGLAAPLATEHLPGGGAPSWRVSLADGTDIVVRSFHASAKQLPLYEGYASRLLPNLDVSVKRYIHFDESCAVLPFHFALTTWLPGRPVLSFADAPDVAELHRQMGALLRQLHRFELPRFGYLGADGPTGPSHLDEWLDQRLPTIFKEFRLQGAEPGLVAALERHVAEHRQLLDYDHGPVFAHNDFHPGNLLAERNGGGQPLLTGLIDFGSAIASTAISDLAKTLFVCEHDMPGSGRAILDGYGPVDHPEPAAALRLHTLLHRVMMWSWLRRYGTIADGEEHGLIVDLRQMVEKS